MSRRASLSEGAAFGILSFALMAVLGVGGGIVIARLYGIEVVGAYALAYAPVAICGTLSTMQEQAALVRELATLPARAPRITGLFASVMVFSTALTLVVGIVTAVIAAVVLSGPIGRPDLVVPALVLLAEYVLVSNTAWNVDMVFGAFRAGRQLFWVRLLHAVSYLAVAIGLSFAIDTVWGLVLAQVAAAIVSLVARGFVVRVFMRLLVPITVLRDGLRTLPDILRFGTKIAPGWVADGVSLEAGTWLLGLTASVPAVGAWSRAWQLARRLFDPTYRITEMLFPTLVERRAKDDRIGFDRALLDSSRLMAVALLLPAAVAGGAADAVMDLFGPGFDRAADALAVLLLVAVIHSITAMMSHALLAFGKPWTVTAISVTRAVIVVALGVPLTISLEVTGMALAMLAGFLVDLIWRVAATRPHLAAAGMLPWPTRSVVAAGLAYAAGFATARGIDTAVDGLLGLGAALIAGTLAFALVFPVAGGPTSGDRDRVRALRDRLRRRQTAPVEPATGLVPSDPPIIK